MADNRGVWGIDIGQSGLKALKLRYAEASNQVMAVAFDYVPHPKILSQPDAIPEELIAQALDTFLERNEVRGDKIAISVPGQTALARFIQLPPVESSKIPEIVKYEAKQQIPFALEDVIWDYQTLGGGIEESGYLLEAEVGLFAMKREQVTQALRPFNDAKLEVELIQIAPLALFNFLSFDRLEIRPSDESPARDEYSIVLDMGADNTTLLVSNGQKIWIRNVPLGGNHFTRALTKEMKLTFAKAEHLKCNATKSPDPRAVFQALRPVFNDYVAEIQRSIGYFSSVNRDAKIDKVIGMGNGFKLAGLQKFLQQNLQYEVERIDTFQAAVGDNVLGEPLFDDNILTFAVAYGLALQGLHQTHIHTSLLPPEIALTRTVRKKKPWAVAAAAGLLLALSTSAAGYALVDRSVGVERWKQGETGVANLSKMVTGNKGAYDAQTEQNDKIGKDGVTLTKGIENRGLWLELYKAISECLPYEDGDEEDPEKQNRIKIRSIAATRYADLVGWVEGLPPDALTYMPEEDQYIAPEGAGYAVTLNCEHFHNADPKQIGIRYVQDTLIKNMKEWTIQNRNGQQIDVRRIGITHPTVTYEFTSNYLMTSDGTNLNGIGRLRRGRSRGRDDDERERGTRFGGRQPGQSVDSDQKAEVRTLKRTAFVVEFAWKVTPPGQRPEERPKVDVKGKKKLDTKGEVRQKEGDSKRETDRRGR
jgi:type IV pilus assembly protein PilM